MSNLIFVDAFDRADGPLGPDWLPTNYLVIESGEVKCTAGGASGFYANPIGATNWLARYSLRWIGTLTGPTTLYIKSLIDTSYSLYATVTPSAGVVTFNVLRRFAGTGLSLGTLRVLQDPTQEFDVYFGIYNGLVYLGVPYLGGLVIPTNDVTNSPYFGFSMTGAYGRVAYVSVDELTGGLMEYSATPPETPGGDYSITLTSDYPIWTPGTPGSPVFAANFGTLHNQEITSSQSATVLWTPPDLIQDIVIDDPMTGLFCRIDAGLLVNNGTGGGGGGGLSEDIINWLQALTVGLPSNVLIALINALTGQNPNGSDLLSKLYYGDPDYPGWVSFIDTLPANMSLIHGRSVWEPGAGTSIRDLVILGNADIADTKSNLEALRDNNTHTLQSILDALPGADDRITYILNELYAIRTPVNWHLGDIINKIDALMGQGPGAFWEIIQLINDLTSAEQSHYTTNKAALDLITSEGLYGLNDVSGWINSVKGDPARTLSDVYAYLGTIRGEGTPTIHGLDDKLDDISAAIANIPTADLGAVLAAIAAQTLVLSAEHSGILAAIAGLAATEAADLAATLAEIAGIAASLVEILSAISGLQNQPAAKVPPVYPGPAGVNFAAPIAFDTDGNFDVACDGVLVNVAQVGTSPWRVTSGNVTRYSRLGVLAMKSTDGYAEPIQPLQFLQQVVTPTTLLHCGGVMVQCKPGTTGTLTPWSLK